MRAVMMVLSTMLVFTGCVNNYITGPTDAPVVTPLLVLPRFNPSDFSVNPVPGQSYVNVLTFNVPAGIANVCDEISYSVQGEAVVLDSPYCYVNTDSENVRYAQVLVFYKAGNLGKSTVTVIPKSNPRGSSSFRVTVTNESLKG